MHTNGIAHMSTTTNKVKQETGVIYTTQDYDQFKSLIGNRPINQAHLIRMINSFEEVDLFEDNPAVVTKNMEVIDGQHRILAAKALNKPVHYIISEKATSLSDVQRLNINNRPWSTTDFLESYIAKGNRDYVRLKEFADQYRLSIPISLRILSGINRDDGIVLREFREGRFKVTDYEEAEQLASLVSDVRRHSPDLAWVQRSCVRALYIMMKKIGDPKKFTNQLAKYQQVITRRPSVKDYLAQFENILGNSVRLS